MDAKECIWTLLLLVAVTLACPISALAGPSGTGGGQGVVCRNKDGSVKSVELLDLWETKQHVDPYLNLTRKVSKAPVETQVRYGIARLKDAFQFPLQLIDELVASGSPWVVPDQWLGSITDIFLKKLTGSPDVLTLNPHTGAHLRLTTDAYERLTPADPCKIEQLVIYDDVGEIADLDMDLINHMDNTNKAALYLHEAFYKILRRFSDEPTSIRVRRAVGYVMSGKTFTSIFSNLPHDGIYCMSPNENTFIRIYPLKSGQFAMTAERIGSVPLMGYSAPSSTAIFEAKSIDELYANYFSDDVPKKFKSDTVILDLQERPWQSPTDYDLKYRLSIFNKDGKRLIGVTLLNSPGHMHEGETGVVSCHLYKGSDQN